MKRKNILALLLVLALVMSLTACGSGSSPVDELVDKAADVLDTASSAEPAAPEEEVPTEVPEEPAEAPEVPEADPNEVPEAPIDEPADAPAGEAAEVEIVVLDNEDCTFTIKGYDPNGYWGYTWKAFLENKTDKNLMFSLDDVSVNGVMCDPFWATTVSAGMKANEEISWDADDFEDYGITDVTVVEFELRIYDNDDWSADDLVDDVFTVYPMGEDAARLVEREPQDSDIVLLDNEYCTIIAVGFDDTDDYYAYIMELYLVNKMDYAVTFSIDDAAVNGFMCDPFWASTVAPGKVAYKMVRWDEDDFAANDITEVESITLPFTVYNSDDWSQPDLVDETFTVNP